MPTHPFRSLRGRIETFELRSPRLGANRLGDPDHRSVAVYLPPSASPNGPPLPVMVALAGYTGSGLRLSAWKSFEESLPQRIERLVDSDAMGPVVVVMPDCFTSLGGNQYVDSAVMGQWDSYIRKDVLPAVQSRYNVRTDPAGRAVFGKSSGGYGALMQGLLHGDEWGALACHSGDMGFDLVYLPEVAKAHDWVQRTPGGVPGFLDSVRAAPGVSGRMFEVLMTLGMAATYDPDPDPADGLGIRLPIRGASAELDWQAWQRWRAWDPLVYADRPGGLDQLRKVGCIFLDVGTRDEYNIHHGTRVLHNKLEAAAVPHVYEEFEGGHSGIDHRLDASLPRLYAAIA
jgi:enterochelin esterase-like enzyme